MRTTKEAKKVRADFILKLKWADLPKVRLKRVSYKRARAEVRERLLREDPACCWCRKPLDRGTATIEHLQRRSKGGTNHYSNLKLACRDCNHARGDSTDPEEIKGLVAELVRRREEKRLGGYSPKKPSVAVTPEVEARYRKLMGEFRAAIAAVKAQRGSSSPPP